MKYININTISRIGGLATLLYYSYYETGPYTTTVLALLCTALELNIIRERIIAQRNEDNIKRITELIKGNADNIKSIFDLIRMPRLKP